MSEEQAFRDLVARLQAGDQSAAAELVRQYEPVIRCHLRVYLTDSRLRRLVDSVDICQSVLGAFFARMKRLRLETSAEVQALLLKMARNKLLGLARKQNAAKRGGERQDREKAGEVEMIPAAEPSPSELLGRREQVDAIRNRLTAEENVLAAFWAEGTTYVEMAARLGGTPDALRMKLQRAFARVRNELAGGCDE
jgi:RNA polymerase sigma factor (sigma-70 family)